MEKTKVGLIGCGNISGTYMNNLSRSATVEVVACADTFPDNARALADKFGVPKICTVEELLSMPEIEIVLNLTTPLSHYEINMKALEAGKHVYCEKPLATSPQDARATLAEAEKRGLRVGCAPDTILGAGLQTSKKLIEDGWIGRPLAATANFVLPGHELWHPAPQFLYKKGAGPVWDMGPYYFSALIMLLGPIAKVGCFSHTGSSQRTIKSQPSAGQVIDVEIPTHYSSILHFECGAIANLNLSWEIWASELPCLEIHGTEGSLVVSDPNFFGGPVKLLRGDVVTSKVQNMSFPDNIAYLNSDQILEDYREISLPFPYQEGNLRGLGLEDMAQALREGRQFAANGAFALHVVESLLAMDQSSEEGRIVSLDIPKLDMASLSRKMGNGIS